MTPSELLAECDREDLRAIKHGGTNAVLFLIVPGIQRQRGKLKRPGDRGRIKPGLWGTIVGFTIDSTAVKVDTSVVREWLRKRGIE
jgi:hypothetical protein